MGLSNCRENVLLSLDNDLEHYVIIIKPISLLFLIFPHQRKIQTLGNILLTRWHRGVVWEVQVLRDYSYT